MSGSYRAPGGALLAPGVADCVLRSDPDVAAGSRSPPQREYCFASGIRVAGTRLQRPHIGALELSGKSRRISATATPGMPFLQPASGFYFGVKSGEFSLLKPRFGVFGRSACCFLRALHRFASSDFSVNRFNDFIAENGPK